MSDKADMFLQDTEDGAFMYVSNPELYKRLCGYMESYHKEQIENVLVKAEKKVYQKSKQLAESSLLAINYIYDYASVQEGAEKCAKWMLEQLRKEFNS